MDHHVVCRACLLVMGRGHKAWTGSDTIVPTSQRSRVHLDEERELGGSLTCQPPTANPVDAKALMASGVGGAGASGGPGAQVVPAAAPLLQSPGVFLIGDSARTSGASEARRDLRIPRCPRAGAREMQMLSGGAREDVPSGGGAERPGTLPQGAAAHFPRVNRCVVG